MQEIELRGEFDGEPWLEKALRGVWTAIPEDFDWSRSAELAHVINGYELAPALGLADAAEIANERRRVAERTGAWEGSAIELWICLFFEHRRARHSGYPPEGEALHLLDRLCEHLRTALIEEGGRGKGPRFVVATGNKRAR